MSESIVLSRPRSGRPHVVIIGGGFAGIAAAKALRHCEADVTIIDRRNHHIFQPLLYQVATAVLAPADVAAPIRQLSARQKNVSVLLAEVIGVDLASRSVAVEYSGTGDKKIAFDYLVLAAGVQSSYFGHDEFARYAPCLKTITDAQTIRSKILGAYEMAESTDDDEERRRQTTFVLVPAR
jgi:NADH dehydrogenase